ncbi:hypothetical protein JG688_00014340 [Phytophthora aleatoria]|uniref:Uncharacterized protein n=1 Tax=Phytophthora aleatoria TaxID=2496075 RepID=A0A8J5IG40_9STRA|nr:hypothetical protein JG688_00014340 [Phytophthora aleatoria]
MIEQHVMVALAAALVHVRVLDADPHSSFTAVYRALEDVERLIFHHKEQFGVHSVHFQQGCEEFLLLNNTLAIKALQGSSPDDIITSEQCGDLLLRAEQHTRHIGYLRSLPESQHVSRRRAFRLITLNNLACHAKHTGKPLAAVSFLERSLTLQLKLQGTELSIPASEVALTRLNLCAVLSQLHRHAAAAAHAKAAVAHLSTAGNAHNLSVEVAQLLLVAHYNFAVELEHLCDRDAAWRQYETVLTVADHYKLQNDLVQSVLMSGGDELEKPLNLPDGVLALNIHTIAEATVDEVVHEAVQALTQAVAGATQWLTDAVRGELISLAVSDNGLETPSIPALNLGRKTSPDEVHSSSNHTIAKATVDEVVQGAMQALAQVGAGTTQRLDGDVHGELIPHAEPPGENLDEAIRSSSQAEETIQPMNRTPSSTIHAVAKATVDAVTEEAVKDIVQAVEMATEWISRAVENELVSSCLDPNEDIAFHNATEWITQARSKQLLVLWRLLQLTTFHDSHCQAEAVTKALEDVARAIGDAMTQDVEECASPEDESHIDNGDNNSTEVEEPQQPPPTTDESDVSLLVPALQIPNTAGESSKTAEEIVTEGTLHQDAPTSSRDVDDGYDDYTPINSPTTEEEPSKTPITSTCSPDQDTQSIPSVILPGRATPPDSKPTPRRQSPITSKRGLGTPRLKEDSPSSAPPAIPSSLIIDETPTELSVSSHSTLPPLILPGVQPTARSKPHQHETPRKTSRQSSSGSNAYNEVKSSRSCSAKVDKLTSRASTTAELELTPMSSARAAALIYTQQPPSSRRHHHHHHHHKPKKLRDYASQTSPPPSPPSSSLPLQPLLGTHRDSNGSELSRTNSKHSPRDQSPLENGIEQKSDGGNSTLFAPLSTTPAISPSAGSSPAKSTSPSRTRRSHGHGHSHKGHSDPSPNKRSGYCPRCVFEGRSCKISDCLKHQVLK